MPDVFAHHAHVFPESANPGGTVERLLRLMDDCGVAGAVCFAPFALQIPGTDPNRWVAERLARESRLRGFGTVDFTQNDLAAQVRQIRELGLLGIKLHPNTQKFDILSSEAMQVYAAAQEHKLFLSFHTGVHHYRLKFYNLLGFDEIAHSFPDLRFSLEHVGGYHFFGDALAVMFNNIPFPPIPGHRPRVHGGLVSVFNRKKLPFWHLTDQQICDAIAQVGAELFIFGLDFPYNQEEDTRLGMEVIRNLPITEEQKGMILGGNLRRELSLP
jgi:predicted TIM-barrel fold metal-dependent hydrolase